MGRAPKREHERKSPMVYFSRDSATAKPSSLTAKEKKVVEEFIKKAEKQARVVIMGSR